MSERAESGLRRFSSPALLALVALAGCEAAPSPPAAAAPPLIDEGALRAKVSVCLGVDAAAAFTFFWPTYLGGAPNARACMAAAGSCLDVLACAGYARTGCTADDDRCDGGRASACLMLVSGLTVVAETTCEGDPDGNTACSIVEDTKYGRGAFCHGAPCTGERCDGNTLVRCRAGLEVRYDCAREGKGCLVANGQSACAYRDACTGDRCTGDIIELCGDGHVVARERCRDLVPGSTCHARMGVVECRADIPSSACADKTEFHSWCEGGVAVTCFAGVRAELDCAALTDGQCQMTTLEAATGARCSGTF